MTLQRSVEDRSYWMLLTPGNKAMLRFPADSIPPGARLMSGLELLGAHMSRFPWGSLPDPSNASLMWRKHRIGVGGLIHDRWFVTNDGRYGGAPNVPQTLPGSLRCDLMLDGGQSERLAENEGYAVIKEVPPENLDLFRRVQGHSGEHVASDAGAIIISPLGPNRHVFVGFVGRCQTCTNPERLSIRALQKAVPQYQFELLPEWKNWTLVETESCHPPVVHLTPLEVVS